MILRAHDYVLPLYHDEGKVGVPGVAVVLQDHNYFQQMPFIEIGLQLTGVEDEDEEVVMEENVVPELNVMAGGMLPETQNSPWNLT